MFIEIKDFKESEFFCKCKYDCDKKAKLFDSYSVISPRLRFIVGELNKLRVIIKAHTGAHNVVIYITSGVRCEKHNKEVGGVSNSKHLTGEATDIKVKVNGELYTHERLSKIIKIYRYILSISYIEKTTHGDATHITWKVDE